MFTPKIIKLLRIQNTTTQEERFVVVGSAYANSLAKTNEWKKVMELDAASITYVGKTHYIPLIDVSNG